MSRRRRTMQRAASVLVLALLVVPLLLSAHRHADQEMREQHCAACTLVRHAPTVATVALGTVAADVCDRVVELAPCIPPTRLDRLPQTGRAPPSHAFAPEA